MCGWCFGGYTAVLTGGGGGLMVLLRLTYSSVNWWWWLDGVSGVNIELC